MTAGPRGGTEILTTSGHRIRRATPDDLPTCAAIWRESLNDYLGRLAQPEIPDDLASLLRLYGHLHATDPTTFLVAAAPEARPSGDGTGEPALIDAFVVVVRRDDLWYLSMLFVRPAAQARGLGRALLAAVAPEGSSDSSASVTRATSTDTAQPISNGLYASLGMVPRIPLLRLVGLPTRDGGFGPLPAGVEAIAFAEVGDAGDGLGRSALAAELDALDRDAAGFSRTADHRFHAREGRIGFLFRDRGGRAVAYGYSSEAGRVGPIAVREAALLGPVVGHLVHEVRPRGAFGLWVPGTAGEAVVPLLRAGFRFDGFPVLLCWDRPFADFSRYIPMSPGLL
ncbi:MAG TPA: GNAT family N-acetyltransferase [Candidatus Limnocylindrales bacterium]|nr:GNAT family N-acetyltransferase [Candidatus Limnocylindrales bacterium]